MSNPSHHWQCKVAFNPEDYEGFIYEIECLVNKRRYIGRKTFWFRTRRKVKGRKNRRIIKKESDWATYTSSSKELNADIKKYGKSKFKFRILQLCQNKSQMAYYEPYYMFKFDVLTERQKNGERKFYNRQIPACRCIPKLV